ncbi:mannose-6-phosphate isomerase, class I [Beduini massiliensis]|uniref:mannose-6-phosphate isomerase, class I n=1 Tax=Beduini massiliensis TaxID=1585974 RepID=UPI00059A89F9|nr:mannose-6-phosphate isomerase, class I [Beduini massiliensis]
MGHILFMEPVFKEMIWGGHRLKDVYNYPIPSDSTGECWAISAHKNGDCTILNGEYKGMKLSALYQQHRELFGDIKDPAFPLLIKIIDASSDLSVQVHPDDDYAAEHEHSLGKTECWYVLDAKPHTQMVMGHHAQTKEELIRYIKNDEYDRLLNKFEIQPGDFYYIPSGTIHAICKGSLIYEAQQSSDITYRVYDYHRKDKEGNERQLHVQQSIDVTTVPYCGTLQNEMHQEATDTFVSTCLIKAPYFSVSKLDILKKTSLMHHQPFSLFSVIEGEGTVNEVSIKKGQHFIVCHDVQKIDFDGPLTLMVTTL